MQLTLDTMFQISDAVLHEVDKKFSLPANYPKGHGDMMLLDGKITTPVHFL